MSILLVLEEIMRILIFVDNAKRDLLGARLIEEAFKRRGVKTRLCTNINVKPILKCFKPHAFLAARGNHDFVRLAARCCPVYIVPAEGGRLTKETLMSVFMGRGYFKIDNLDWIRRCYLWNEQTKAWLLEAGFKPEQLLVTGSARLDPYKSGFRKKIESTCPEDFVLGVAISAHTTSAYYGKPHFAETYFKTHPQMTFPVVPAGHHFEDIVWRDHSILRLTMQRLRWFLENRPGKVVVRPSPFEDPKEYYFLQKMFPGRVTVKVNQMLVEFLSEIDLLLTCWSTTGLEALLHQVPVVSISGLIDQTRLFDHIHKVASGFESFVPYYHMPSSVEEFEHCFLQAESGELSLSSRTNAEVAELLKYFYGWPTHEKASERIAQDVISDLQSISNSNYESFDEVISIPYKIPVVLSRWIYEVKGLIDFIKSGTFKSMWLFNSTKNPEVERVMRRMCESA